MKPFMILCITTMLTALAARAGTISITLDDPNQIGNPGATLKFFGTITNIDANSGDAPIYLNIDSLNLALSDAIDNDLFLANVPIDLGEGTSSGDIELFDYTLANPESDPFGPYTGTNGLLGGMDGGDGTAQESLVQVNFVVDVEGVSSVPEPSSLALFWTGLAFLAWLHRERRIRACRACKR